MPRRGPDRGRVEQYPLRVSDVPSGSRNALEDLILNQCPRTRVEEFYDFNGEPLITEDAVGFTLVAANAGTNEMPVTNTSIARAYYRVKRAGIITGIAVVAEDAMVANGTNFLTFTALNLQVAGSGNRALLDTTAHVNTTDADATSLNAGTSLTAKVVWPLALTATTASLYVKEGDLIEVSATATQTPAAVDAPRAILTIRSLPLATSLKPTVTHTAGATTNVPIAIPVLNSANGEALLQLSATNEAQVVRLTKGDQLTVDPTKLPMFTCRLKVSGVATATRMVWGLATAYNATFDSVAEMAWFRLEGNSLALVVEADDATTDTDDQSTSITLTADTYYLFTIDFSQDTGKIRFFVDNNYAGSIAAPVLTNAMLMQPFIAIQKDSGTGTQSITVDTVRVNQQRF